MAASNTVSITAPEGFLAAGTTCGIKASGKPDLALVVSDRPCAAAGVFTVSRTPAAPVAVTRAHLKGGRARAIVVNSGNANASTGRAGEADARRMCELAAEAVAASGKRLAGGPLGPEDVLVASTGIIGRPLPMEKVERGIATLASKLGRGKASDAEAAAAIMTTDLTAKTASVQAVVDGQRVRLGGICKGSGMIAPNMATMLAFVTTDAAISPKLLQQATREAAAASFNRISVDQHTSPSDMLLVLANGAAGNAAIREVDSRYEAFRAALAGLCRDLAEQIVRDGEGATKVFRVCVKGAKTEKEADLVAKAVVNSPLVKTAVHGGDPNWGRVTTAAGYSGAAVNPDTMSLYIKATGTRGGDLGLCVYRKGVPEALTPAHQKSLATTMAKKDITFTLELGQGSAEVEWLGCDLSRQYIAINADYTT